MLPLLLTITYKFPFLFGSPLYTGSPSQKFNSPWVEPFTHLRNAALSLSFDIIQIRYKQKHGQHRSHLSLMNYCSTRLITGTVRKKKTTVPEVRFASNIELKYGTVKDAKYVVCKF